LAAFKKSSSQKLLFRLDCDFIGISIRGITLVTIKGITNFELDPNIVQICGKKNSTQILKPFGQQETKVKAC
jgi:hypothetical protein